MTEQGPAPTTIDEVPGWFPRVDQRLFGWLLDRQEELDVRGDLLEMGCYLGKSAVLIGRYLRGDETFTVCDLFDSPAPDGANQAEMSTSYGNLTRAAFERNYRAFHERLPTIVQAPTSEVPARVENGSCRFVHIDASHLYEHVVGDISAARAALREDGVVVCDDYRSEHTPGVAAAVWAAVESGELRPICVTTQKLYGTWADPAPFQEALLEWLAETGDTWHEVQRVAGARLIRVKHTGKVGRQAPANQREELRRAKESLTRYEAEVALLRRRLKARDRRIKSLKESASFRVGRAITAPPRVILRSRRDS
ncbi:MULTISPECIES: class I SAM-dependent methyltransferase [Actinomadura]|uniref:Class I SAM-dependent methyltransferase n=1 Tax=Actinomadura yumaensis TaxID=111807 RepID=A0ABW2CTG0_9ACTN|nr:class I SAM-dependent methyltransferase [Actinomadura sp. J1-007]MWK35996.1 class I SAM-dependent methyltransferase [Actinomadura sp. J1-007]